MRFGEALQETTHLSGDGAAREPGESVATWSGDLRVRSASDRHELDLGTCDDVDDADLVDQELQLHRVEEVVDRLSRMGRRRRASRPPGRSGFRRHIDELVEREPARAFPATRLARDA